MPMSRRAALKSILAILSTPLIGCDDDNGGGFTSTDSSDLSDTNAPLDIPSDGDVISTDSIDYFDFIEELQAALRASPDHLPARADALVQSKNPQEILDFVRDQIQTIPGPLQYTLEDLSRGRRWGTRPTLRGGTGTAREKADLLASLYQRAGFTAEVWIAVLTRTQFEPLLLRPVSRTFSPVIDDARLTEAFTQFGFTASDIGVDPNFDATHALADRILNALPASILPTEYTIADSLTVPIVRVDAGNGFQWANPFVENAVLGEHYSSVEPELAPEPAPASKIRINLSTSSTVEPDAQATAAEAEWSLEDVVGRQVLIHFTPSVPPTEWGTIGLDEVQVFIPTLAVQALDSTIETERALSVQGDAITTRAETLRQNTGDNTVMLDGQPIASGEADPNIVARVSALSLEVDASAFPSIRGRLVALDAAGNAVRGLTADAFSVEEDGTPRAALMLGRPDTPPRIGLRFDRTDSIPAEFQTNEQLDSLIRGIVASVLANIPDAQFRAGGINNGWSTPNWTQDPDALVSDLSLFFGYDGLWGEFASHESDEATLMVVFTDGRSTDQSSEIARDRIRSGPPSITLLVDATESEDINTITRLNGGIVIPVADQATAIAQITAFATAPQAQPLAIRYVAPLEGELTRNVRVSLRGKTVESTVSYTRPNQADVGARAVVGIHVSFFQDDEFVAMRTISGRRPFSEPPTQIDTNKGLRGLFSNTLLSFEGGAPPLSVLLDDLAKSRLSRKDLMLAAGQLDAQATLSALQDAKMRFLPSDLLLLHSDVSAASNGTFPINPRVVRWTQRYLPSGVDFVVDILPFTQFASWGSPSDALVETIKATSFFGIAEGHTRVSTTLSELGDKPLVWVEPEASLETLFPSIDAITRERWSALRTQYTNYILLGPADGATVAAWAIHRTTGTVIGVGLEGGKGESGVCGTAERIDNILSAVSTIGGLFGASPAFGFLLGALGIYVKLIVASTIAIQRMDGNLEAYARILAEYAASLINDGFTTSFEGSVAAQLLTIIGEISSKYASIAEFLASPAGQVIPEQLRALFPKIDWSKATGLHIPAGPCP